MSAACLSWETCRLGTAPHIGTDRLCQQIGHSLLAFIGMVAKRRPMRPSLLDPLFAPVTTLEGVGPKLAGLLQTLQPLARDVLPALLDELARSMPTKLTELDAWTPPWEASAPVATSAAATPAPSGGAALLFAHRASTSAHAARLGEPATWAEPDAAPPAPSAPSNGVAALLADHPAALAAHTRRLDRR